MAGGALEHQKDAGGLEEAGKYFAMGGGRQPGISPVIQGGDTISPAVRVGVLGTFICDDKGGGGNPQGFYKAYH